MKKKPDAFMVPVSLLVGYMALVISYLVASNRRIYQMSHTDQGTQLLNRRARAENPKKIWKSAPNPPENML